MSTVEDLLKELDMIIAKLRIVKAGDIVLSADHNDLVYAVKKIREILSEIAVGLPYKTENVNFTYLAIIDKILAPKTTRTYYYASTEILARDMFTDKAIFTSSACGTDLYARYLDSYNQYIFYASVGTRETYMDIVKKVDNDTYLLATVTWTTESYCEQIHIRGSVSGSALKMDNFEVEIADPLDLPSPTRTITATDTTFSSGYFSASFGRHYVPYAPPELTYLLPPSSPSKPALAVVEVEVEGSGRRDDPFRPAYLTEVSEEYSVGSRMEKTLLSLVSWGAFEFSRESPTNIITVFAENPRRPGALQELIEYTRSKGLRVLKPPRDYIEAVEQYRTLKRDFQHWLAGVHNYCYQTMGLECFDWMQNVDFYYGELLEHRKHYKQLKQVPDWEIRRRLATLEEKLKLTTMLTDERDKHLRKIREITARGW